LEQKIYGEKAWNRRDKEDKSLRGRVERSQKKRFKGKV
jgi:hypothetical protein